LEGFEPESLKIVRRTYKASGGEENFISVEDSEKDILVGFIRLRIPSEHVFRPEINSSTGLIRELHVYGRMTPVGLKGYDWQHKGWGEALIEEAERLAEEEYKMDRMVVMSALGTKEYFWRLGYSNDGPYVSKLL
jgi:elongator complex protein 3